MQFSLVPAGCLQYSQIFILAINLVCKCVPLLKTTKAKDKVKMSWFTKFTFPSFIHFTLQRVSATKKRCIRFCIINSYRGINRLGVLIYSQLFQVDQNHYQNHQKKHKYYLMLLHLSSILHIQSMCCELFLKLLEK